MTFKLHPNFESKIFLHKFPLTLVLMEDSAIYPWLFLIPQKNHISKIMDLTSEDQLQLIKELDYVQKIMWEEFSPTQLNVAAIGNKTPQLHVHVIARYDTDPAWPGTVWGHPQAKKLEGEAKKRRISRLQELLAKAPF